MAGYHAVVCDAFILFANLLQTDSSISSLTTKKQTTKFSSANFHKKVTSNLYHIENSKTRGQTV